MKEFILVSGGRINIDDLEKYISNNSKAKIIAIDKGIEALYKIKVKPEYILGDFDSVDASIYKEFVDINKNAQIDTFSSEKDYTDTELGIRCAIANKANMITIFGATGTRIDHELANIRLLYIAHKEGIFAQIIDEHNRIYLGEDEITIYKKDLYGKYISILPYNNFVKNISLKGFKYELENDIMQYESSLGISNEVISDVATITCRDSIVIIIESND